MMFLLATPTSTSSMITGRWVHEDTCPCFCNSSSWLLQLGTCQLTEVCDRQTTTGAERRHTSRQRHLQVRPWTVTDSTCQLALAQCGRSGLVQARCYGPPMSPQQSTAVSGRLLRSSLKHCQSSAIHSARRCLLTIPRHRRSTLERRAFSVAGPTVWNLLPDQLRDSDCTESTFQQSLKTFFFNQY